MRTAIKIWKSIVNPGELFNDVAENEISIWNSIAYYAILNLIVFAGASITQIIRDMGINPALIALYLGRIASSFITFLILIAVAHLLIRLFGGEGNITQTYKALLYGVTPAMLTALIPYLDIAGGIYMIYTTTIGIRILHRMRLAKAITAYICWLLIIIALISLPLIIITLAL